MFHFPQTGSQGGHAQPGPLAPLGGAAPFLLLCLKLPFLLVGGSQEKVLLGLQGPGASEARVGSSGQFGASPMSQDGGRRTLGAGPKRDCWDSKHRQSEDGATAFPRGLSTRRGAGERPLVSPLWVEAEGQAAPLSPHLLNKMTS